MPRKAKQYSVQVRNYHRQVDRPMGYGRTATFSKWRTLQPSLDSEEQAVAHARAIHIGLTQVRVLFGKGVVFSA